MRGIMLNNIYKKNPDVVKRKIADELILVPIGCSIAEHKKIFSLNELGEYIYDSFDGVSSLKEILELILKEFSIDQVQAEADLLQFVAKIHEQGIIISE